MSWQDSFQPTSQGWQSSFQPEQASTSSISEDVAKSTGSGLGTVAMDMANPLGFAKQAGNFVLGNALTGSGGLYEAAGGEVPLSIANWMRNPLPESQTDQIAKQIIPAAVQAKTGMDMNYQPQTGIGEATKTAISSIPLLAGGEGSIPQLMMRASGIGLGSETGGQIAQGLGAGENGQQVGKLIGGGIGGFTPEALEAAKPAPLLPISDAIKQNLLNQNPDVRTYAGEDLGQKLSGAEQNAYINKNQAYEIAKPAAQQATLAPNHVNDLATAIEQKTQSFDPTIVKNATGIQNIVDNLRNKLGDSNELNPITMTSKGPQPVSWADVDQTRQKLYNLPKSTDADAAVRAQALSAYHDFTNNLLQKGLIDGDPSALNLLKDANSKNAQYFKQFDANKAISNFIDKQGGIDSVAPETLLDQFTKVGQAGFDNVRAAKEVLGDDASPILKQGYLNKIRSTSMDANGEIVPAKLQTSINTLLQKNPTLSKFIFTSEEIDGLNGISNAAGRYAKNGAQPGVIGKVISHIPIAKSIFAPAINSAAKAKMMNNISNPRMQ